MSETEVGYCPRCRTTRTLRGTDRVVGKAGSEGLEFMRRRDVHCSTCNTFVSSTETPLPATVIARS